MERRGPAIRLLLAVGALVVAYALVLLVYALLRPASVEIVVEREAARGDDGAPPGEREAPPRTMAEPEDRRGPGLASPNPRVPPEDRPAAAGDDDVVAMDRGDVVGFVTPAPRDGEARSLTFRWRDAKGAHDLDGALRADGRFSLRLPDGVLAGKLTARVGERVGSTDVMFPGAYVVVIELHVAVVVRVLDERGDPITGASVRIGARDGGGVWRAAFTGPRGEAVVDVRPGPATLVVWAAAFTLRELAVEFREGDPPIEVRLTRAEGRVTYVGTVSDERGPVAGARVRLEPASGLRYVAFDEPSGRSRHGVVALEDTTTWLDGGDADADAGDGGARTDAAGRFTLASLVREPRTLWVELPDGHVLPTDVGWDVVGTGAREMRLRVPAVRWVEGVVRRGGRPVEGWEILLAEGVRGPRSVRTAVDGSFRLPFRGDRRVIPIARGPDGVDHRTAPRDDRWEFDLPAVGRVRGRVLDREGRPIADAVVGVKGAPGVPPRRTAADGAFDVEVTVGSVRLTAVASGYARATSATVVVEPDRVAERDVRIEPGGSLGGQVTDASGAVPPGATVRAVGNGGLRSDQRVNVGSHGLWRIDDLAGTSAEVTVEAPGHETVVLRDVRPGRLLPTVILRRAP